MSHITVIQTQIRDLAALEEALKTAFPTARLVRDRKSFHSYQGSQPCDHAITVDGVNYQLGLRKSQGHVDDTSIVRRALPMTGATTTGFEILHDFFGSERGGRPGAHDGMLLQEMFGDGCQKLVQEYAAAKATRELRKHGATNIKRRVKTDGTIVVRAQV